MNIRELKQNAAQREQSAPQARKIVLIYGGITVGLAALATIVNYCLGLEISQTGGLRNIGIRSVLSTIQTLLPMAQMVISMCLELGYLSAMLRISRGQYASPNSLRMGIDRFWPLLRCTLLQAFIYFGITMLSVYLSVQIFLLTPLSNAAMELASDFVASPDALAMMDDTTYLAFSQALLPLFPIFGIVCLLFTTPVFYQYRLANYILIDNPRFSAFTVLRESRMLMKRRRMQLFRLDLSLWWYYVLSALASVVAYGDVVLPMLGITLPMSDAMGYFLFFAVYLVLELVIFCLFLNRISVTYALYYEELRPKQAPDNAVVLGNIFQM